MRRSGPVVAVGLSLALLTPPAGAAQDSASGSLVLQDLTGDLHDLATGEPLEGPGYMDLTGIDISADGGQLMARFEVAEVVPEAPDPQYTTVDYILNIDTDGDGFQNYHIQIGSEDGWQARLFDHDTVFETELGEAVVVDDSLVAMVLLSELGSPTDMRFQGLMASLDFPDPTGDPLEFTESEDLMPDGVGEWRAFGESDVPAPDDQVAVPGASPTVEPA